MHTSSILVIGGSVRPRRIGPQVARWVAEVGRGVVEAEFEVIDLKDWPLPMDDEPGIPAAGDYQFDHTRAWSRKIAAAQGFVLVTPQYNWGYPAALKNALDHLFAEWAGKPVMLVTYGGHGGDRCAEQLQQVCQGLHMQPIATKPALKLSRTAIEADLGEIDPAAAFSAHLGDLQQAFGEMAVALKASAPHLAT